MFSFGFDEDDRPATPAGETSPPCREAQHELKAHTIPIAEALECLPPRISYVKQALDSGASVFRREYWDLRMQVMAEANDSGLVDQYFGSNDLVRGVYEGGCKTWECSIDLANYVSSQPENTAKNSTTIELGCGSALPSCVVLLNLLKTAPPSDHTLVLQDYNHLVLTHVTVANLLVNWYCAAHCATGEELDVTQELKAEFVADLDRRGIRVVLVAGAWGGDMLQLLAAAGASAPGLVLASETIYAPESQVAFMRVVDALMQTHTLLLLATKLVYFGVGGNAGAYVAAAKTLGIQNTQVFQTHQGGLGRVIYAARRPR